MSKVSIFKHNLTDRVFKITEEEYPKFIGVCKKLDINWGIPEIFKDWTPPFDKVKDLCIRISSNASLLDYCEEEYYSKRIIIIHTFQDFRELVAQANKGEFADTSGRCFDQIKNNWFLDRDKQTDSSKRTNSESINIEV